MGRKTTISFTHYKASRPTSSFDNSEIIEASSITLNISHQIYQNPQDKLISKLFFVVLFDTELTKISLVL